jgi:hypothetical protein
MRPDGQASALCSGAATATFAAGGSLFMLYSLLYNISVDVYAVLSILYLHSKFKY